MFDAEFGQSQIDRTVVKAFALQADGLGFTSPSGYKVGRPGHSKYVWVGQYEPSCLKFPSRSLWINSNNSKPDANTAKNL